MNTSILATDGFSTLRLNTNISHWDEWKYTNVMNITMEYDSPEEYLILVSGTTIVAQCFVVAAFLQMAFEK